MPDPITMPVRDPNAEAARRLALRRRIVQRLKERRQAGLVAVPTPAEAPFIARARPYIPPTEPAPQRGFAQRMGAFVPPSAKPLIAAGARALQLGARPFQVGAELLGGVVSPEIQLQPGQEAPEPLPAGASLRARLGRLIAQQELRPPGEQAVLSLPFMGLPTPGTTISPALAAARARMAAQAAGRAVPPVLRAPRVALAAPEKAAPKLAPTPTDYRITMRQGEFTVTAQVPGVKIRQRMATFRTKEDAQAFIASREPVEGAPPVTEKPPVAARPGVQPPAMKPTEAVAKEPWQMTQAELRQSIRLGTIRARGYKASVSEIDRAMAAVEFEIPGAHYRSVQQALSEGKPVPAEVLADLGLSPDLAARAPVAAAPVAKPVPLAGARGAGEVPAGGVPAARGVAPPVVPQPKPPAGTREYMAFWRSLTPEQQRAELIRRGFSPAVAAQEVPVAGVVPPKGGMTVPAAEGVGAPPVEAPAPAAAAPVRRRLAEVTVPSRRETERLLFDKLEQEGDITAGRIMGAVEAQGEDVGELLTEAYRGGAIDDLWLRSVKAEARMPTARETMLGELADWTSEFQKQAGAAGAMPQANKMLLSIVRLPIEEQAALVKSWAKAWRDSGMAMLAEVSKTHPAIARQFAKEFIPRPVEAPAPAVTAWETGAARPFAFDPNSTANQGRFRLQPPEIYNQATFRTRQSTTPGVSYIVGKRKDGQAGLVQAIRFDKGKFSEAQAAKWWEANQGRFQFAKPGRAQRPVKAPLRPAEAPGAAPPPEGPPPTVTTGALPPGQAPRDPNELVQALARAIRGAKKPLAVKEAEVSRELGTRAAKAQARLQAGDRIGARAAFVGELPDAADILPISKEFSAADGEALRGMIISKYSTGNLGDSFRFMQTDTAFTKLWDKGQIPTRSELVALEEVFGKPFVEAVLSLRSMPSKTWELFMELWNTPRAMLASGDLSASARQAAPFIFTGKGKPWLEAFETQLKAWKSETNALASVQRIAEHPLYAASQRAGLDLTIAGTLRRAAAVTAREEPYIGARLLAKIPVYGRVVRASERAYVTMLNELRFSTFVREAEKLGAEVTTGQLRDIASAINILSGRAPLGKFAQASTILNGIFFAPRWALSRVIAPTTLITGSAASRKLAAQALVSYATTVTGMLFLADVSGVAKVEWNPLSADFGKAKFGNIRIDPWAGLQQPVVLAARLATGKTKQLSTGQVKELDAGRAIWQFLTSKLQPSPRLVLKRGEGFAGEAPLEPSPIPRVPRIVFDNFVFIFVQDILEAYAEAGPKGLFTAPLSILGVGVQTFRTGMSLERERRLRSSLGPQVETTLAALNELRIDIGEVGKKLDVELGVKGGEVDLTPAQRDALQALTDEIVISELQTLFAHPTFQAYSDEEKKEAAKEWITSGRAAAREQFRATLESQAVPAGRKAPPAQAPSVPIGPGQSNRDALRQRILERLRERRAREAVPAGR